MAPASGLNATGVYPNHFPCDAPADIDVVARLFVPKAGLGVPQTALNTIVGMCVAESEDYKIICSVFKENAVRYARAWPHTGLSYFDTLPVAAGKRTAAWYKLPVVHKTLRTPGVELVFWTDADSLFMTTAMPLPVPSMSRSMAFSTHWNSTWSTDPSHPDYINSGHFSIRPTAYSESVLRKSWATCPPPWMTNVLPIGEDQKVDMYEQTSLIYVLGGSEPACRNIIGAGTSNAKQLQCALLKNTSNLEVLDQVVMNQNIQVFDLGDLVLHLWGAQCGNRVGKLLELVNATNLTRMEIQEKTVQALTLTPKIRDDDPCLAQTRDKAYILKALDSIVDSSAVVGSQPHTALQSRSRMLSHAAGALLAPGTSELSDHPAHRRFGTRHVRRRIK